MSIVKNDLNFDVLERAVLQGDLSKLSSTDRIFYYKKVCESLGLNPLTKPFEYISLNGKLTLYARKDATEQLRKIHGVSIEIKAREVVDEVYVVTARATDKEGKIDESIGSVSLSGLKGESKANAMMKAETKAKRRVTLSICGLGMLDESETDSIKGAKIVPVEADVEDNLLSRLYWLIEQLKVSDSSVKKWLEKARVKKLEDLSSQTMEALVDRLYEKLKNKNDSLLLTKEQMATAKKIFDEISMEDDLGTESIKEAS